MKQRIITITLICVLVMSLCLSGCVNQSKQVRQGTSDNEVLNLEEIPRDKLMLTMRMADGMDYTAIETAIETEFPNVDIVIRSNTDLNSSIAQRDIDDIVMMINGNYAIADLEACFIDLSSENYVQNYYISSLQQSEMDGKLFYLPGPSNIYGIVYNKDMFRDHGWTVPKDLDSFLSLCIQIEQEGIRAIQPALYYKDATRQFFTGFIYDAVLSGGTNAKWLSEYRTGNAVMEGHMEPAFDILDRLIEAGVLRSEDFEMMPGDRSDMMYSEQSCAMILETQAAPSYAEERVGDAAPELGLLPFFSGSDEDSDYFLSVPIYYMAASKKLEEPGSERKLAAVREIFAYFSTVEGQEAVIGENSSVISSVKGVGHESTEFLDSAIAIIEKGHIVPQPFFVGSAGTEVDQVLRQDLMQYASGEIDRDRFMADMDQARDLVLQNEKTTQTVIIGTAEESFSIMETSILIAKVFQEKTGAQIGLCPANTRMPGNNWKIYQGGIQYGRDDTLDNLLKISFQHKEDENKNEGKLVKVRMTGESIIKSFEPLYVQRSNFQSAYMTASGLKITFAPWAGEGNRYVSVKLADGSELDPDASYTVAFWNGSVDPALIDAVEAEYDDTAADLLREWIEGQGGSIKPNHKDFTLDWTITESVNANKTH